MDEITEDGKKQIYQSLMDKYKGDPENINPELKSALAMLATTRYMDMVDNVSDIHADMAGRVRKAEQLLAEGGGNEILTLIPIDMLEYAELKPELSELAARMQNVLDQNTKQSIHAYEKSKGYPLSDFQQPLDKFMSNFENDPALTI